MLLFILYSLYLIIMRVFRFLILFLNSVTVQISDSDALILFCFLFSINYPLYPCIFFHAYLLMGVTHKSTIFFLSSIVIERSRNKTLEAWCGF